MYDSAKCQLWNLDKLLVFDNDAMNFYKYLDRDTRYDENQIWSCLYQQILFIVLLALKETLLLNTFIAAI